MITRDVFGREAVLAVTTAEAAAHDLSAQQAHGIPERVLMENAGRALAAITHALYPSGTVVGVGGAGHNGGDTIIALRVLQAWGRDVALVNAGAREPDFSLLHGATLPVVSDDVVRTALGSASAILDGILGTGAHGPPREQAAQLIRALNAARAPVVAVDLPSGIDADKGSVHEDVIQADVTVTFGQPKIGMLFQPARAQCGRLITVEIGLPSWSGAAGQLLTPHWAAARFPRRTASANKGTSGRLLMLVGSTGMAGAAVIAGCAAVRSGAGLVRIASTPDNREIIQKAVPEAVFSERDGEIDGRVTAFAAGPGMGANDATRALLQQFLQNTGGIATLLDADALNVFAGNTDALAEIAATRSLLLTPHPMELSRLTGAAVEDIVRDPIANAQRLADATHALVLLKGQPSIIAQKDEAVLINTVGSSDFAVAGMGDQLTGVIGAMLAAGLDARSAAGVGLYFSGRAGDIAGLGRSLTPADVTEYMSRAFAQPGPAASALGLPFITFDQPPRW